jgi:hypothetical protein
MLRRKFLTAALVATVAACVAPAAASAGFRITYSQTGGPTTVQTATGNDANFSASLGDYQIVLNTESTDFPGDPGSNTGNLTSTLSIKTVSGTGTAADLTITVQVVDDSDLTTLAGFTTPSNPTQYIVADNVSNTFGASLHTGTLAMQSIVNGTGVYMAGTDLTLPPPPGGASAAGFAAGGSPYTLQQQLFFTGLNLGINSGGLGVTATSTVWDSRDSHAPTVTPAPAGLVLIATAVPFFGLLRRRMKAVPTT